MDRNEFCLTNQILRMDKCNATKKKKIILPLQPRRTPSHPLQKKKRVREKLETSQPRSLSDHHRNPLSDETCTRTERLARPMLRQDPRTFREVRFWTTFLRSELSLFESILKCWNIHLGTTLRTVCEEVWPRPQPEGEDLWIVRERWANFRRS